GPGRRLSGWLSRARGRGSKGPARRGASSQGTKGFMRLIERYLFRQLLGPTLLATAALTGVAVLSQSLSALDILVAQRQSPLVFARIIILAMPQLIVMILPVAVFVAALVALNRLHTEQEIVICFAGGMSRWRVISPSLRLAGLVSLLALAITLRFPP